MLTTAGLSRSVRSAKLPGMAADAGEKGCDPDTSAAPSTAAAAMRPVSRKIAGSQSFVTIVSPSPVGASPEDSCRGPSDTQTRSGILAEAHSVVSRRGCP